MTILHLLAAYGLCFGLMQDKVPLLTESLRRLPLVGGFFTRLLDCAYCTGFHCGWVVFLLEEFRTGTKPTWYVDMILFSFASATFCYMADVGMLWLERDTSDEETWHVRPY